MGKFIPESSLSSMLFITVAGNLCPFIQVNESTHFLSLSLLTLPFTFYSSHFCLFITSLFDSLLQITQNLQTARSRSYTPWQIFIKITMPCLFLILFKFTGMLCLLHCVVVIMGLFASVIHVCEERNNWMANNESFMSQTWSLRPPHENNG